MRRKILVIRIALALVGLLVALIGLSWVAGAQEAPDGAAADTQAGQQLHHVLGDGVADTPLEMHELYKQQDGGADGQLPGPNE